MQIGVLTCSFILPGCRSLKEKRQRLGGFKDRFGKQAGLAVCESGYSDAHQRAEWSFVAVAQNKRLIEQTLSDVERKMTEVTDAQLVDVSREFV
jgi:uncharacterized protein YlxP (DUF503 family)